MEALKQPVPLMIVTGFLGSGKTTLINFLLEDVGSKEKLAIIKNEIGDIAVDSRIIRGKNIVMKELLNGCVCCTLIGGLEESLEELVATVCPDRIIIETSGAANPAILAVNVDRMPFVKRDLIVTVVDTLNFITYKDKSIVVRLQHKFTDLIVLNRIADATEEQVEAVLDEIYELRPGISVVRTATGRVDPDVLFGINPLAKKLETTFFIQGTEGASAKEHLHEDAIESFSFKTQLPMRRACFEGVLSGLSEEYYRVKGFVLIGGADGLQLVNFVCGRVEITPLEDREIEKKTRVVFIGKGIKRYEAAVVNRLKGCD